MTPLWNWVLGYLLNSIWEVPLLFAAGALAAWLIRRLAPQPRVEHRVWVGAMLLEVILPACNLRIGQLTRQLGSIVWRHRAAGDGVGAFTASGTDATLRHVLLRVPAPVIAIFLGAYICSLAYFAGRMAWGLWQTSLMQQRAEPIELLRDSEQALDRCRDRFGVADAVIRTSSIISGPVTVGILRRVLLVPPAFLDQVAGGDLEAVVAHEFAHMRRRDFAKNVAYGVLTLPASYHPMLWWTRSRVAESREMVCDALAAEAVAGRERYARSLLRLAAMLADRTPARTLHAIGIFDANIFERRIMNLTQRRVEIKGVRRLVMAAVCVTVGLATCASALALRENVGVPVVASGGGKAAAADEPRRVSGGVMAGNVLSRVTPVYPQDAKDAKISGAVVLQAIISKEGVVEHLEVVSGPEKLRASALDAVRQWTYKPYLLNGNPTDVETTITVNYSFSK
ncbi:M56 family metallopeptidase [Granulicella arctica]|uniref:M56 family metallopeptidase n=1 Tax=Granulicella arctica TaxID=940613 RepID=UPI0021E03E67|nr:M56 family metallopeptidase [Granulicella arctica]